MDRRDAVAAIGRIEAIPTLLRVLRDITGMQLAMVVHICGKDWTVCAVDEQLNLGLTIGGLAVRTNLAEEAQTTRAPIVISQASAESRFDPDTRGRFQVESYVSVPIFLPGDDYFGALIAFDPLPRDVGKRFVLSTFRHFAALIAIQIPSQQQREDERSQLLDQRTVGERREQFIAILGHDLRNPLQAVFAGSLILQQRIMDPALSAIALRIKSSARRMSLLIDDVVDFAHGRWGGGMRLELITVDDINIGLNSVVEELQDAQPDRRIISNIAVDRMVRCDLGRLQRVVSNLLANALQHGDAESPVMISALAIDGNLVVDVQNGGEPIRAEHIGRIFEPFWHHSVSARRQGLGLGLHICAQIVRAHCGEISVVSTREHGTQFTVRLPLGPSAKLAAPLDSRREGDFSPLLERESERYVNSR